MSANRYAMIVSHMVAASTSSPSRSMSSSRMPRGRRLSIVPKGSAADDPQMFEDQRIWQIISPTPGPHSTKGQMFGAD